MGYQIVMVIVAYQISTVNIPFSLLRTYFCVGAALAVAQNGTISWVLDFSDQPSTTTVIANQSADWCGNPFSFATSEGDADRHVAAYGAVPHNDSRVRQPVKRNQHRAHRYIAGRPMVAPALGNDCGRPQGSPLRTDRDGKPVPTGLYLIISRSRKRAGTGRCSSKYSSASTAESWYRGRCAW